MPRQLRIQYEGAIYHLLNRGDRREEIFRDDLDRKSFLQTLGAADRSGVRATYLHRLIDRYWSPGLEAVSTRQYLKMLTWLDRRQSSVKRRL